MASDAFLNGVRRKTELHARTQPHHVPGQPPQLNHPAESVRQALSQGIHVRIRRVGHDLAQDRAHCRQTQCIRGQRGSETRMTLGLGGAQRIPALRNVGSEAPHARRQAAGDRLAEHENVRLQPMSPGVATRSGGNRMRLIDQQQRAGVTGRASYLFQVPVPRQHHAAISERRFHHHASHIVRRQRRHPVPADR